MNRCMETGRVNYTRNYIKAAVLIILMMAGVSIIGISLSVGQVHKKMLLLFFIYLLFFIQLPGLLFVDVFHIKFRSLLTKYPIGFFTGFGMITFVYYLSTALENKMILVVYGLVLSIIFCVKKVAYYMYNLSGFKENVKNLFLQMYSLPFFFSLLVIFFISMLYTQGTYPDFKHTGYVFLYPDNVWHMGIVNSLSQGFPPEIPWYSSDNGLYYHYFTDLLYGIGLRIFNISADVQILSGTPYLLTYIYGFSAYAMAIEFNLNKKIAGFFVILSIFGVYLSASNYQLHILKNVNSVGYAAAAFMCVCILLNYCMITKSRRYIWGYLFIVAIHVYILTGLKGPYGAVLIAGIVGTGILALFIRHISWSVKCRYFVTALVCIIAFGITYIFFMMQTTATDAMAFVGISAVITSITSMSVFNVLGIFSLFFIMAFGTEIAGLITRKIQFNFIKVTMFAVAIAGILIMYMISLPDGNNGYFGYVSATPVALLGLQYISDSWDQKKCWSKGVLLIFAISLIFCIRSFYTTVLTTTEQAIASASLNKVAARHNQAYFSYNEYKAMLWIRENTSEDALLASDKCSLRGGKNFNLSDIKQFKWYNYSGYSQRNVFLEGTAYYAPADGERTRLYKLNCQLYDPNNTNRSKLAKDLGIDYVIVTKRLNPTLELSGNGYCICFENKAITIYEVK